MAEQGLAGSQEQLSRELLSEARKGFYGANFRQENTPQFLTLRVDHLKYCH